MTRTRIKVGDRVSIDIGGIPRTALVIENRGNIGIGGRHLVRLQLEDGSELEMPSAGLTKKCAVCGSVEPTCIDPTGDAIQWAETSALDKRLIVKERLELAAGKRLAIWRRENGWTTRARRWWGS